MKTRSTKSALISSALALLLCVSMLLGTTYAWFTDSVTSENNIIKSGNLDIELEYLDAIDGWTTVENSSKILDPNALWEPGYTQVVYLRMRNAGSLALKYQFGIQINDEKPGVNSEGEFKLSDYIYFGVDKNVAADENGNVTEYKDRAAAQAAVATVEKQINKGYSDFGTLDAKSDYQYMALVVYMPTSVGNVANYVGVAPEINLGISVFATQTDADTEKDSFGSDYDAGASIKVEPGESLADAIANVEDGGIVYLGSGEHNIASGPIVIEGKEVTIVGVGEVLINKNYGKTHIFTVKNGADVTIKNVTMDGKGNTREGVYVRWNSKVTLENVVIKNTGGLDIMVDEASDVINGFITESTASYVKLINSHVEDVAMCAAPTQDGHIDTFVYFNYDANSTVGNIEKQSINLKPENIFINGVNTEANGMNLYVTNDAELAAALETIKTNSKYHNVQVYVHLAAGVYSGNYEINQYPAWNGVAGAGATANNYASGVPAGAPGTVITFVGESAATTFAANSASVPGVVFTGKITVNGFGNAGTGFGSTFAHTTFENVAFDGTDVPAVDGDIISVALMAAADNVTFNGCYFANTTHITLGGRGENRVDDVVFDGCTFVDAGSLSGYPLKVTLTGCQADGADGGFLNIQNQAEVVVEDSTVNVGRFFIRTNGTGVKLTVADSDITVYESEGTNHLVYFRGSNESATFTDCTIADGYTTEGVDANSALKIYNYSETEDGLILLTESVSDKVTLYEVPADYEGDTLTVPAGVTALRNKILIGNKTIKEVIVPIGLTDFGGTPNPEGTAASGGFFYGSVVEKITLPEGLTEIPAAAFNGASNLKEVNIPSTVTTIGINAFRSTALTNLTIPETVESIGYGAFRDMTSLTTVTIEGDIYIRSYTFRSCVALETVYIKGTNVTFEKGMIFTCYDTGDGTGIKITVPNEEIKARLLAADSAASTYGGYEIDCEQTTAKDENGESLGYYVDEQGNAYAYDAKGLDAALTNTDVKTVVLPTNLYFSSSDTTANSGYGATGISVKGNTLDGNGNSLGISNWGTWDAAVHTTGGTIKNITINSGMRGIFMGSASANVYIENVIIDGTIYTFNSDGGSRDYGVYISNSTLNGWTSFSDVHKEVVFTNCKFGEGQGYAFCRPYNATSFVGCDFEAGFEIEPLAAVDFVNCTYAGQPLTPANLTELVTNVDKVTLGGVKVVYTTAELLDAIKNAPVGETTYIGLADGVYAGDIAITEEALGTSGGDVVIKALGDNAVISGTVTLGYRDQGTGATMYNANVTFEGVTFDHVDVAHSLDIQDVKSLTLRNCTIIGDGEYGISSARGNGTGTSTIVGCTFVNAGLQLLGNYATGLVIDDCTFNNSCINVQAGNGVTVQNCTFNSTLTDANNNESFYVIRSNATPITVTGCKINIDSTVTGVGVPHATKGWGVFVNRGTTNWTVSNVEITLTEAAQTQTALEIARCTSTGAINMTDVIVNGVQQ